MEQMVTCFLMVQKLLNLKQKDFQIVATLLCLGNISKNWSEVDLKKLDLTAMFMILVLLKMLLLLMTF